jgi:hypothetical protein
MEVSPQQITNLSNRLPKLELSYETVVHKKVSTIYDICVSIPTGKRQFAWFTYDEDGDVCYLMDLTRDGKIGRIAQVSDSKNQTANDSTAKNQTAKNQTAKNQTANDSTTKDSTTKDSTTKFAFGTILYGTLCDVEGLSFFIADDIYYYKGIYMKPLAFGEKMGYLTDVIGNMDSTSVIFKMACMETITSVDAENQTLKLESAYVSHHLQYRASSQIMPYLNHTVKPRSFAPAQAVEPKIYIPRNDLDFGAPAYKSETVFRVMADVQSDIYLLYAYNETAFEFVDIAYIGSRKESAFMNSLFRNIRENLNVDYGEESEDEDMFQNTSVDKYVDLKLEYRMICSFHHKFKKWVPVRTVDAKTRCVNLSQLTRRQGSQPRSDAQRPYQSASQKPYQSASQKPYQSASQKPYQSDATRPYRSDAARPYRSDVQRPSAKPYQSDATRPYQSDAARPYQSASTKPQQSEAQHPYRSEAQHPYRSDAARPYRSDAARPYQKPQKSDAARPYQSEAQHPYQSEAQHPYTKPSQSIPPKPIEKKPYQHNRERNLF